MTLPYFLLAVTQLAAAGALLYLRSRWAINPPPLWHAGAQYGVVIVGTLAAPAGPLLAAAYMIVIAASEPLQRPVTDARLATAVRPDPIHG
jgi:hypothetical protein